MDVRPTNDKEGREELREKGQFFTPQWITTAMSAFILRGNPTQIFEPGFGTGAFFVGATSAAESMGVDLPVYRGCETDESALTRAIDQGVPEDIIQNISWKSFFDYPDDGVHPAIIGNPPYIRHHRLSRTEKRKLSRLATDITGKKIDKRAGYHVYFLIKSLEMLKQSGRLSFILPADVAEGKFSKPLWSWISEHYQIHSVVTFSPDATPFPGVDTNAIIFNLINEKPQDEIKWLRCNKTDSSLFKLLCTETSTWKSTEAIEVFTRTLDEAMYRGLSRPLTELGVEGQDFLPMRHFCKTVRGIATGANSFFWMSEEMLDLNGLSQFKGTDFIHECVGRTRDVQTPDLTREVFQEHVKSGKPAYLLSLSKQAIQDLPNPIQEYIQKGVDEGLHERTLVSKRNPWYNMEKRDPADFLFAYLGRRNNRFIRNTAGVINLTGFLCVYAKFEERQVTALQRQNFLKCLSATLNHPETVSKLSLVGKSYGDGAIKVEPRQLDQLPIMADVAKETGLDRWW